MLVATQKLKTNIGVEEEKNYAPFIVNIED